jgi:hypothetical protein
MLLLGVALTFISSRTIEAIERWTIIAVLIIFHQGFQVPKNRIRFGS